MTAQEARAKAQQVNTDQSSGQMFKINTMISNAVSKGEYSIWFYETMHQDVRTKLTEMGYNVGQPQFDRNETLIKISWDFDK